MTQDEFITPTQRESLERLAGLAQQLRASRAGIEAALAEPGGPEKITAAIQQMREASMTLARVSRELTKTADVMVSVRRKKRWGIRV